MVVLASLLASANLSLPFRSFLVVLTLCVTLLISAGSSCAWLASDWLISCLALLTALL